MSLALFSGLVLQVVALLIVIARVRGRWFTHLGALFVIVACVYHGLAEVLEALFPGHNDYRLMVTRDALDAWVAMVGIGILVFALTYSLCLRTGRSQKTDGPELRVLPDWRLLLILTIPGYLLAISDSGGLSNYWVVGLSNEFTSVITLLTGLAYLCSSQLSRRRLILVLVAQSLALMLLGERSAVLFSDIVTLCMAARWGIRVRWARLLPLGILVALLLVTISATRVVTQNHNLTGTASDRLSSLTEGFGSLVGLSPNSSAVYEGIVDDFAYRVDGNSFGAMLYTRQSDGWAPAGFGPLGSDLRLIVPSFLNPNKLGGDSSTVEEKASLVAHYGLQEGIDYIITTLTVVYGCFGATGLFLGAALLGVFFAAADRWLANRYTLSAALIGISAVTCIVTIEQGLRVYFVTARGLLVLLALVRIAQLIGMQQKHGGERADGAFRVRG